MKVTIDIEPFGTRDSEFCDPECLWRRGELPTWFCRLFQRPLVTEYGLACRCLECRNATR